MSCAWCKGHIWEGDTTGDSSLYSPDEHFLLCEPCWLAEDELIDERGTNEVPELIAIYRKAAA